MSKPTRATVRWLAFSDTHCPLQDPQAIAWLVQEIEEHKPDVLIHCGDGHEADAASKFPNEHKWTLKEEFDAHNAMLEMLRKAAPQGCKCVFLPGNHDDNILAKNRIDEKLRDLCDWRTHEPELANWQMPIEYIYSKREGVYRIGQVAFFHGFEATISADKFQSFLLGVPFGLCVSGHTHRPTPRIEQARATLHVPLPYWFANCGCMCDLKPYYMRRKRSHLWGQACVVGEAQDNLKSPRMGRAWDADMRVFRMYGEDAA